MAAETPEQISENNRKEHNRKLITQAIFWTISVLFVLGAVILGQFAAANYDRGGIYSFWVSLYSIISPIMGALLLDFANKKKKIGPIFAVALGVIFGGLSVIGNLSSLHAFKDYHHFLLNPALLNLSILDTTVIFTAAAVAIAIVVAIIETYRSAPAPAPAPTPATTLETQPLLPGNDVRLGNMGPALGPALAVQHGAQAAPSATAHTSCGGDAPAQPGSAASTQITPPGSGSPVGVFPQPQQITGAATPTGALLHAAA